MRAGLAGICEELGIEATAAGFGGVFSLYFAAGPVRGYRDLMRNNDGAYVAFHRRMTDRGFLMLPLSLKRNHISAAHTREDVDRTLDAARDVLRGIRDDGLLSPPEARPPDSCPPASHCPGGGGRARPGRLPYQTVVRKWGGDNGGRAASHGS